MDDEDELRLRGEAVIAEIEAMEEGGIQSTLPLTDADAMLIGELIQHVTWADFNGRRLLQLLDEIEGLPPRSPNHCLRDNEIIPAIRDRLDAIPGLSADQSADLETALSQIDRMVDIRHAFAHLALRRHWTDDVVIGFSMNNREAQRKTGSDLSPQVAMTVAIPMEAVRSNMGPLSRNSEFFAIFVGESISRFSRLGQN